MLKIYYYTKSVIIVLVLGLIAFTIPSYTWAARLPDLMVSIRGPGKAYPGKDISDQVKIVVRNIGNRSAQGTLDFGQNGYMVDLVLSKTENLPIRFSNVSSSFRDGALLRGGRVSRTRTLQPGNQASYSVGATIPRDTPPGRYCLGVVVDPGKAVRELSETNNAACHWVQIDDQTPQRFLLRFPNAYLVYEPGTRNLQIAAQRTVLSYGENWEIRRLKPYLYQFRRKGWKGFHWQVNTSRKQTYMVRGGTFGQLGGRNKVLNITVDVVGRSENPTRFFLRFSDAYLIHEPRTKIIQIAAQGTVLSYGGNWEVRKLKPYLYHLRRTVWNGFYWKLNTSRKQVYKVSGGNFGRLGGTDRVMNIGVEVVY